MDIMKAMNRGHFGTIGMPYPYPTLHYLILLSYRYTIALQRRWPTEPTLNNFIKFFFVKIFSKGMPLKISKIFLEIWFFKNPNFRDIFIVF